ncbi:MAG: hypothetical protein ACLGG2_07100 [Gammaproteobacteria bacterium]
MRRLLCALALAAALPVQAWEVGEFRHGMSRAEVEAALASWNFDRSLPVGPDSLFVYDGYGHPASRRFLFTFCNDRLVALEQEVAPAFRHFVIIASNYSSLHGDPFKVIPYTSVVASGEKNLLAMFWRRGGDFLGVKYVLHPTGEQLTMSWQIGNTCWQAPR